IGLPIGVARIVVVAATGLAAEAAGLHHARLHHARPPARLVKALLPERLRYLEPDVDADEVGKLERAHAKSGAHPDDAVDHGVSGDSFGQKLEGLHAERPGATVCEEAGAVADDDHLLSESLAGAPGDPERVLRGLLARDDLEQVHRRHGVEEVHADDVLWMRGATRERRHG